MKLKSLLRGIGLIALLLTSSVTASSKTLPQGVFMFDVSRYQSEIDSAGANRSGDDRSWDTVDIKEAKMSDVYALQVLSNQLNAASGLTGISIDTDTLLVEEWKVDIWKLDLGYGITDDFMVFANIQYDNSVLDIHSDFVAQSRLIDQALTLLNPAGAEAYHIYGEEEKAEHFKDIYVGFKYRFAEKSAFTFRGTFDFLKVGKDHREITKRDNFSELTSGDKHDTYQFFLNSDVPVGGHDVNVLLGYIHRTQSGYQNFLDVQERDIHYGDSLIVGLGTEFDFCEDKLSLGVKGTHVHDFKDQWRNETTGEFEDILLSDVSATYGSATLTFKPEIFLNFWLSYHWVLDQELQGSTFQVPGRLGTADGISFGMKFFYK